MNQKFFIAENGNLVVLYINEAGTRHVAVCEPIEDVVFLSVVKEGRKVGKGQRLCKKCGQPGHTKRTCPKRG
ncbi:MAG: hypothetical protein KJI72_00125 [Patescibacteria group bacterium]|nr:hypothetical protein [Patescibacteria group bacterium]